MDKLSVLQHQNQKLALQLEEKRRESRELEKRLASHEAKDQEYSHTLLCVRRLWDQLDSDVQRMCNGMVQDLGHLLVDANGPSKEDSKPAVAFIDKDPFLARLLAGADTAVVSTAEDTLQEMESDCSGVEKALQAKSISSKHLLSRLLDLMRTLHARSAASNGSSGGTGGPGSLQPDARMRQLEQALDTAAAQHRLLTEQHSLAMDRLVEAQARIRQLEDEAVDHQQAMSSAQRKLLAMQQSSSQQIIPGEPHGDAAGHPLRSANSSLLVNGEGLEDGGAEEASALLAKRTAELDAEREAHLKTNRELTEAKARLGEESSWVASTRAYQALSAELAVAHEALASRQRDLEAMLHEKELAEARLADRNILAQRECQLAARLAEVAPRMQALLIAKTESDAACTEAETTLMCERQRLEGSRTAAELRTMVNVLQTQLQVKEQQMEQAQVPLSRITACTEEVMAAKAAVAEAQAERELARRSVTELTATVQDAKKREDALHERICDMQAFVDVLSSYCGQDAEAQELATAHAQLEALNVRCAALQSQLDTCHGRGTAAQAAERTAAERLSQAQSEVVSVRGQLAASKAQAEELSILLAAAKSECSLYTREIESTSAAYIEMQTQNQRLLGLLADKEEEAAAFAAEKLKLKREEARLEEAVGMGRAHVERLSKELQDAAAMREASEREMGRLATELAGAREQLRVALWRIASLEAECHRREEAVSSLTVQLDASQKAGASSRQELADEVERGTKERHKRQRLEDENKSLTVRLAKLRKAGAGGSAGGSREELTEEVEAMRKLLNCSVCHDRQKNVIITKCGHVFCDECVNRTIASRNRKCPGCGLVFSPTDIKPFFFT